MTAPTPEEVQRLQEAYGLVRAGRAHEARAMAAPIAANAPWISDAHHILGLALKALGEADAAESAFAAAVRADPHRLEHRQEWGRALSERGHAGKREGDLESALALYRQAAEANPASHAAEQHIASACVDLRRYDEAAAAAERAFAKGASSPEAFFMLGVAQQGRGRLEAAEAAFREAVARRTNYVEAHRRLAGLIWARTSNLAAACAAIDSALVAFPDDDALRAVKASLFSRAGEARAIHAAAAGSSDLSALVAGAEAALQFDPKAAVDLARRAAAQTQHARVLTLLCSALLANGQAGEAASVAGSLLARSPRDQQALALQATAWRILGDPRYRTLYDYDLVRSGAITAPRGWPDLTAYLADLKRALDALDGRGGGASLLASGDRAIRGLLQAIEEPIGAYLAAVGQGEDPLRARNRGGHRLAGAWSVRAAGGDQVRAEGWLSGEVCVDVSREAMSGADQAARLSFGEPGVRTAPPLEAEHFVRPEPGLVILFPSYMWRGAASISGEGERLTVAFDVLPA